MSDTGEQTPLTTEEQLAKAEERAQRAEAYRDKLRRIAVAEHEIPQVWKTGEVKKSDLAGTYGVSVATVGRILERAGFAQQRIRRLTDEERQEINQYLINGTSPDEIATAYGISRNAVRNVGLKMGSLRPGERKPQRTDEDYERIAELDALAIQRFGSGLYNLGVGLRAWRKKKEIESRPSEPVAPAPEGAGGIPQDEVPALSTPTPEPAHTTSDPQPGYPVAEDATPLEQATDTEDANFRF